MDAKKILKELAVETRETARVNLNLEKGLAERALKAFPRNKQPSLSKVVERLLGDFLNQLDKKK